jgi:hypothetical protein
VLGQDQDTPGGRFEVHQCFSGAIAQFGMWDRQLSLDEISKLAVCDSSSSLSGNVFALDSQDTLKSWIMSSIVKNDVSLSSLCLPSPLLNRLFMVDMVSHKYMNNLCSITGGKMPIPTSLEMAKQIYDQHSIALNEVAEGLCRTDRCRLEYYTRSHALL